MKNKVLAFLVILAGPGAAVAQGAAAYDSALSGARALGLAALTDEIPPASGPERAPAKPEFLPLPEGCLNMPVLYSVGVTLYSNGEKLGDTVSSYKGACSGDVAWLDTSGYLYKNKTKLGQYSRPLEIATYTGDVIWADRQNVLRKNAETLGAAKSYKYSHYTGIVVWTDNSDILHKDGQELGRARSDVMSDHTGDVIWIDRGDVLHKNAETLGRPKSYAVAERTGDVAWLDGSSTLYLNSAEVGANCKEYKLREDGKMLWWDNRGDIHFR